VSYLEGSSQCFEVLPSEDDRERPDREEEVALRGNPLSLETECPAACAATSDTARDSALYRALGYVPKRERKSGLRRMVALKKAA
jgi:hypothetical protein